MQESLRPLAALLLPVAAACTPPNPNTMAMDDLAGISYDVQDHCKVAQSVPPVFVQNEASRARAEVIFTTAGEYDFENERTCIQALIQAAEVPAVNERDCAQHFTWSEQSVQGSTTGHKVTVNVDCNAGFVAASDPR